MPVDVHDEAPDLVHVTVSGRMVPADQVAVLSTISKAIERAGRIRLLIVLADFEGWTSGEEWADDALRLESDSTIVKARHRRRQPVEGSGLRLPCSTVPGDPDRVLRVRGRGPFLAQRVATRVRAEIRARHAGIYFIFFFGASLFGVLSTEIPTASV